MTQPLFHTSGSASQYTLPCRTTQLPPIKSGSPSDGPPPPPHPGEGQGVGGIVKKKTHDTKDGAVLIQYCWRVVVGLQDLHLRWYGLQPGWGPPSPQLTTLRRGVDGNWARYLFPAGRGRF